jgi:lipopolysaccharide transport system ATP-binding protein
MNDKDIAISAKGVSKLYRIGAMDDAHENLVGVIADLMKSPLRNFRKYRSLYNFSDVDVNNSEGAAVPSDVIWALRDVSFDIGRGEVVGIIGVNGAGKSTLLKILSRITPPTKGSITINGRVNSLLEVGTGFHQELTGRENIYMNGIILGMRKKEVDAKFDQIVDFSGVEKFLDTPVKRYSSGMRVRLAFAVAAHLEPEILIIDEVLAVGDAAFQKKCMNKMQDVGEQGRTVLLVSHNMQAITRMCERVIMLDGGRKLLDGTAHEVVSAYLQGGRDSTAQREWTQLEQAPGGEIARLCAVRVRTEDGNITEAVDIWKAVGIEMEYEIVESGHVFMPSFALINNEGVNICVAVDQDPKWRKQPRPPGRYVSTGWIPGNLLAEGLISVNVTLWVLEPARKIEFHQRDIVGFQVIDSLEGNTARGDYTGDLPGVVRPLLKWTTQSGGAGRDNITAVNHRKNIQ